MSAPAIETGLWGKLPSRGDFVRLGLGRRFTDPWDAWMSAMLAESQAALGAAWQEAWMVAPVWRFCLEAGLCGPEPVLGVWMPSVDRAGRAYPLTLAAIPAGPGPEAEAWLDAAEAAGRAALAEVLEPAAVASRLIAWRDLRPVQWQGSAWWKECRQVRGDGLPPPSACCSRALPDAASFVGMLA